LSWPLLVVRRKLALRFEFVTQVVERVIFALGMGAEGGAGSGDEILKVGDSASQAVTKPGQLVAQERDGVESLGELAAGRGLGPSANVSMAADRRNGVVVLAGYLLKINDRVVLALGRDDRLLRSWAVSLARSGRGRVQ
jgi:hypothetical protein